jgi:hypothetical protein
MQELSEDPTAESRLTLFPRVGFEESLSFIKPPKEVASICVGTHVRPIPFRSFALTTGQHRLRHRARTAVFALEHQPGDGDLRAYRQTPARSFVATTNAYPYACVSRHRFCFAVVAGRAIRQTWFTHYRLKRRSLRPNISPLKAGESTEFTTACLFFSLQLCALKPSGSVGGAAWRTSCPVCGGILSPPI